MMAQRDSGIMKESPPPLPKPPVEGCSPRPLPETPVPSLPRASVCPHSPPLSDDHRVLLSEMCRLLEIFESRLVQRLEESTARSTPAEPPTGQKGRRLEHVNPKSKVSQALGQEAAGRAGGHSSSRISGRDAALPVSPVKSLASHRGGTMESLPQRFASALLFRGYSEDDRRRREEAQKRARADGSIASSTPMTPRSTLEALCTSRCFRTLIAIAIATNSIFMGLELEVKARSASQSYDVVIYAIDTVFTGIFTLELVLRALAFRCELFSRENRCWTCLDAILVATGLVDTCAQSLVLFHGVDKQNVSDVGTLRVFRVLRVTRSLRALRMTRLLRFVASLRTLITSIWATLQSLIWAFLLLCLIIYSMAVLYTQATTDYLLEYGKDPALEEYWGTMALAMLTLFKSISGGVSWHEVTEPLGAISQWLVALFSMYVFLVYFAVLNVITGVFCQSAIETVAQDPDLGAQSVLQRKRANAEKLRALFCSVDKDLSGQITIAELEHLLDDEHMQAYLAAMGVDADDAWSIFKLIDVDGSLSIDVEEFVSGLMRLQGSATSVDVRTMMESQKWMARRMTGFMNQVEHKLSKGGDHLRRDESQDHQLGNS